MEENMQGRHESSSARTIDYNSVCQMIGHLYLEWHNAKTESEKRYSSIIDNLSNQISELISENESLKTERENERT